MALTFADTHNVIAYLTKSDASEGFDQIINFLNRSSIKYALTVNPNIYVSCIQQSWTSVLVKNVNDVTRLQALVDKKKVIITEATIRDALRLNDVKSIDCLPNEKIFTELSRMETLRNEFSSFMASADICLSTGKGFSGVDTPLFEGMLVAQQVDKSAAKINVDDVPAAGVADEGAADVNVDDAYILMDLLHNLLDTYTTLTRKVENLEQDKIAQALEITKLKQRVKKLEMRNKLKVLKLRRLKKVGTAQRVETSNDTIIDDVSKQERIIADMDADVDVTLKDIAKDVAVDAEIKESVDVQGRQAESQAEIYQIYLKHAAKVLSIHDDKVEPVELQEVVEVVTTAKLITEVVTAASATITVATPQLTAAATPTLTTAPTKSKDKGKWILVEEPKPLKKQAQIEQDEAYARELEAELNKNIDWDEKTKEQMEEEDNKALKRLCKSQEDKASKREDLEVLWQLVKERFASSKPKNVSDDFLLTTLRAMFEKPDIQAQI
nr:hypothetical protein [Tanacetum cinerariifolium]